MTTTKTTRPVQLGDTVHTTHRPERVGRVCHIYTEGGERRAYVRWAATDRKTAVLVRDLVVQELPQAIVDALVQTVRDVQAGDACRAHGLRECRFGCELRGKVRTTVQLVIETDALDYVRDYGTDDASDAPAWGTELVLDAVRELEARGLAIRLVGTLDSRGALVELPR